MFSASFLFPFQGCCCCSSSSSDVTVRSFISRQDLKCILYFPFTFCLPYFSYISVWLHRLSLQLAYQLLLNLMPESPFHKQKPRADPVSSWFNLPARGIMEVLGTVHMLSSSDLYPNVRATPQISAKRKPSAVLAKLAANGNLTKLKYGSPVSTLHISRSRLIYLLSAKEFCWCIVRGGLYWFTLGITQCIASHTSRTWVQFHKLFIQEVERKRSSPFYFAHRKKKNHFFTVLIKFVGFQECKLCMYKLDGVK